MSIESKKSDPSFPTLVYNEHTGKPEGHYKGVNVLDYFAAKAIHGILSAQTELRAIGSHNDITALGGLVSEAYAIADAMVLEREKRLTTTGESL